MSGEGHRKFLCEVEVYINDITYLDCCHVLGPQLDSSPPGELLYGSPSNFPERPLGAAVNISVHVKAGDLPSQEAYTVARVATNASLSELKLECEENCNPGNTLQHKPLQLYTASEILGTTEFTLEEHPVGFLLQNWHQSKNASNIRLRIPGGVFQAEGFYTVRFSDVSDDQTRISEWRFRVSANPTVPSAENGDFSDVCVLLPAGGISLIDKFCVECQEFVDPLGPLVTEFSLRQVTDTGDLATVKFPGDTPPTDTEFIRPPLRYWVPYTFLFHVFPGILNVHVRVSSVDGRFIEFDMSPVQFLEANFNPFEYSNNSHAIRADVIGLSLKCGNVTIPVSGLSHPIDILTRRKNESLEKSLYVFQASSLLGNLTVFEFYAKTPQSALSFSLEFNDTLFPQDISLFLRTDEPPTPDVYNWAAVLPVATDQMVSIPWEGLLSNTTHIHCRCNHLTKFSAFVAPNPLNIQEVMSDFKLLLENPIGLIVVLTIFVLYLPGMVWSRRTDKKDVQKAGIGILPGHVLNTRKDCQYIITVYTGYGTNAGTTAEVKIALNSLYGEATPFTLRDQTRFLFEKGGVDSFLVSTEQPIGGLTHVRVWHDSGGHSPGWFLRQIVVTNRGTGETSYFLCNRWLAADEDDGKVHRVLPKATPDEMTDFRNLFLAKSARDMNDDHVWFSVLGRPARSPFTRAQRLSCCLTLLYSTMFTNIMFFGRGDDFDPPAPIRFAGLVIKPPVSLAQVMISIQTAAIILPVNLLIVFLFRHSNSTTKADNKDKYKTSTTAKTAKRVDNTASFTSTSDDPDVPTVWSYALKAPIARYPEFSSSSTEHSESPTGKVESCLPAAKTNSSANKTKFSFPWWTVYIALTSSARLFADDTAAYNTITSIQDQALLQQDLERLAEWERKWDMSFHPGKCQTLRVTRSRRPLQYDYQLHGHTLKTVPSVKYLAWVLLWAAGFTAAYFTVLYTLSFGRAKAEAWIVTFLTTFVIDLFLTQPFKLLAVAVMFGLLAKNPAPDHEPPSMEARLTEQREKRRRRKVVVEVLVFWLFFTVLMMTSYMERSPLAYHMTQHEQNVILEGGDVTEVQPYSDEVSDKRNFSQGWIFNDSTRGENEECNKNLVPPNVTGSFEYNDCATEQVHLQDMWKYTSTVSFASGIPYVGEHGTYRGGGYIASLGTTERSRFNITTYLRQHNWLDDQTRAVFVELVLYNPHVNLFTVLSLAVEFTNLGAAYTSYDVITVRLIQHDAVLLLLLRVCLVLFLLYFAFTEGKKLFFRPLEYVNDAWNWLELVTIAVGFCTLCMYFYSQDIIDDLSEHRAAGNDAFIMYKDAVDWFQVYSFLLGLFLCCATLKFLRILRFNSHVYALSMTMKRSFKHVARFMITVGIIVTAFTMMANLVFGTKLKFFISMSSSLQNLLLMMLGSFNFEALLNGNRILGPLFFFWYQVMMQFFLLSMFMAIIMDIYAQHKQEANPEDVGFVSFLKQTTSSAGSKVKTATSKIRRRKLQAQKDTPSDILDAVGHVLERLDKHSASYDSTL
ncbi:PREDICTED: polycystic kidney disease protein 1-like 2 [Branchiostoma belcheri]|uniref:Polycystic kidney disease protein 1-like 2 n=1 Tax=Branchiostoma belcheri TaxID=7741 RepID=A0A6P4YS77_BRABE|nr:PREDICTED: polycystic kidney disease protein 1-like 2 [Branchiostoma belcheri]